MLTAQQLLTGQLGARPGPHRAGRRRRREDAQPRAGGAEHLLELLPRCRPHRAPARQQSPAAARVSRGSVCAGIGQPGPVPWCPAVVPLPEPEEVLVELDSISDHHALLAHAFGEADPSANAGRAGGARLLSARDVNDAIVDRVARDEWEGAARFGSSTSSSTSVGHTLPRGRADRRPAHAASATRSSRAPSARPGGRAPRARARPDAPLRSDCAVAVIRGGDYRSPSWRLRTSPPKAATRSPPRSR